MDVEVGADQVRHVDETPQRALHILAVTHNADVQVEMAGVQRLRRKAIGFVADRENPVAHPRPRLRIGHVAAQRRRNLRFGHRETGARAFVAQQRGDIAQGQLRQEIRGGIVAAVGHRAPSAPGPPKGAPSIEIIKKSAHSETATKI